MAPHAATSVAEAVQWSTSPCIQRRGTPGTESSRTPTRSPYVSPHLAERLLSVTVSRESSSWPLMEGYGDARAVVSDGEQSSGPDGRADCSGIEELPAWSGVVPDTVRHTDLMLYVEALPRRAAAKRLITHRGGVYALGGMTGTKRCESYSPPAWMMCSPLLTLFS